MFKHIVSLGAAALAGLTAACEEAPRTVPGTWRSPAAWSTMVHATRSGPMLVQVHGTPFGMQASDFAAMVAETMSRKVVGRVTLFTADPQAARSPEIRVVMAFNVADGQSAEALCRGEILRTPDTSETLSAHAAFCHDDKLLASVRGWVARVDGPGDKRFRALIAQMTRELFPGQ